MGSQRVRQSREIREGWWSAVVSAAQTELLADSPGAHEACARFWARSLAPLTRLEELVLQGLAVEVALGHLGENHRARGRRLVAALTRAERRKPSTRRSTTSRIGPCTRERVVVAAARIVESSVHPLDITRLAQELNCRERALRERFRQVAGVSIRAYHVRARVAKAVREYLGGTTDVLALERLCGYQASKNFYRAFANVLGIRPGQLRQVPRDELRAWLDAQSALPVNPLQRFNAGGQR